MKSNADVMPALTAVLVLVLCFHTSHARFLNEEGRFQDDEVEMYLDKTQLTSAGNGSTEALLLTPYIEAGKLAEARQLSEVKALPGVEFALKSYSGFFTVNKTFNSNLFFWFFPALNGKTKDVPVLLWLQGGPGSSSMFGLFTEIGPIQVEKDLKIVQRSHAWNEEFAVLFIDNPVGTGFSFTDNDQGYANNEIDVGRDLYEALKQFFTMFEDYRGNPFYLTGESYAGKYIPAIAHKIHSMGEEPKKLGINLQGLAIGNGFSDPRNMANYGDFLFQIGLIDEQQRAHFLTEQEKFVKFIDQGEFEKAFLLMDQLMDADFFQYKSYFQNATGLTDYFNYLAGFQPEVGESYPTFLKLNTTRQALHLGSRPRSNGEAVEKHLLKDIMVSVKPWVEELLDANYRTLFYSGQLDIIVATPLTENFLKNLHWKGSTKYDSAPRKIYRLTPKASNVAGYVRQVDNLYFAVIRNAGHMVPTDQPQIAFDLITRFVRNIEY